MFPKAIEVSWSLLHLLDDDWKKIKTAHWELEDKYRVRINESYLRQVISQLKYHDLIETKRNGGIRRCTKKLIFFDEVLKAFDIQLWYPDDTPYHTIMRKISRLVRQARFNNDAIEINLDDE